MSAIYEHIITREPAGLFVNMHFDYADETVAIAVDRDEHATLTVRLLVADNLFIRMPEWVPAESVEIDVDGKRVREVQMVGSFAYLSREQVGQGSQVLVRHALPSRRTEETMQAGESYQFAWRGDEITGIYPNELPLPFYPTLIP